jgi:hypothetical protein
MAANSCAWKFAAWNSLILPFSVSWPRCSTLLDYLNWRNAIFLISLLHSQNYVGYFPATHYYNLDNMSMVIAKVSTFGTRNNRTQSLISIHNCLITVFPMWIVYAIDVSNWNVLSTPSSVWTHFRKSSRLAYRFIPSDKIYIVPNLGIQMSSRYSANGCCWLASLENNIHHTGNGANVTLGSSTVDGSNEESRNMCNIYRSYWHDCPHCYPNLTA